jgi:hypothetical protein
MMRLVRDYIYILRFYMRFGGENAFFSNDSEAGINKSPLALFLLLRAGQEGLEEAEEAQCIGSCHCILLPI